MSDKKTVPAKRMQGGVYTPVFTGPATIEPDGSIVLRGYQKKTEDAADLPTLSSPFPEDMQRDALLKAAKAVLARSQALFAVGKPMEPHDAALGDLGTAVLITEAAIAKKR